MTSSRQNRCAIRAHLLTATACLVALTTSGAASAAGLLIADGGFGGVLEIKEHVVKVTINNGVAVTVVDQVFVNTENREVEALYTFPVPKGASVSNFSMWIGGKEMIGEVVEKERARQIYNSYKRQRRDPGLLEQVDYKTFEMRIYPIPAGAEQRVRVSYYQQLDFDHDTATYVYPLATATRANIDQRTTGRFAFTMRVLSEIPIASMDSPSHKRDVVVAKHTNNFHEASYEADGGSLARDVVIAYQTTRPKTGFDVITSRPGGASGGGSDGYFMMTVTAGDELEQIDQAMDYVFVLDISGSMANDNKLITSKNAIRSFIDSLGVDDRFDVITFNVEPTMLFKQLFNANPHSKETAADFLDTRDARGGTTLAPAMSAAYRYGDPDRPLNVVILSDGMTEQGEHNELKQLINSARRTQLFLR